MIFCLIRREKVFSPNRNQTRKKGTTGNIREIEWMVHTKQEPSKRSDIHDLHSQIQQGFGRAPARIQDEKGWGATRPEKRDGSSLITGFIMMGYAGNIEIYHRTFWFRKNTKPSQPIDWWVENQG